MKQHFAFGSLLLLTSQLVAPAVLAQIAGVAAAETVNPPAVTPDAGEPDPPPMDAEGAEASTPGAGDGSADIVVIGRNIPDAVRATPQVVSVLSSADIERTGEGDIAGALQRVTGLSVVASGYVYVRGLGDRYSSSLLNGSPLPSPEPLRRVVPLDIFPTNVVASALVQKSYSASYPGEFGGGVINLTTRAVPEEPFLQIGGSASADTETTSELGYTYDGGSADMFGYDDGERDVPGFIREAGRNGTSAGSQQLTGLSNAPTTLLQENHHLPGNWSGELSFGTSADVGGARLGMIAGGGISNGWRTRDAVQQVTNDAAGGLTRDFRAVTTDNRVLVNGLLGLGAELGEHRLRLTNVYIHDTLKQGILAAGSDQNLGVFPGGIQPFIEQNTNWFERQLFTTQGVAGLSFGPLGVSLRGAYANTQREAPYERAFRYQYSPAIGDYINNLSGLQEATIAFSDLDEDLWSGALDLSYELNLDRPVTLSAGYAYSDADRTASRYFFRFVGPNNGPVDDVTAQLRPDYLLSDYSILVNGITLRNESTAQGSAAYDASLRVHAGYVQAEGELADGLRAIAGVRYEDAAERVLPTGGVTGTNLANDYWLPAATITWNFAEDMQLRLHGSRTIARPQFRELAPQIYQDYESNRQFFGNPLLTDSELWNLEARGEWFFGRDQRVTLAGFYKRIDHPIEAIAFFANEGSLQTGFSNAPSAQLYGGEIEVQKYVSLEGLPGDSFATRRLVLIANYTYTQSRIEAGDELVNSPILGAQPVAANLLFRDGAPLVGQSDHLVNLQVGIEDTQRLSQLTLLFTYASDRVTNRGPTAGGGGTALPDLIERPGARFDIVARQGFRLFGADLELKIEGRNLTKTRYQEFQTFANGVRVDTNSYDLGRVVSAGLSATF